MLAAVRAAHAAIEVCDTRYAAGVCRANEPPGPGLPRCAGGGQRPCRCGGRQPLSVPVSLWVNDPGRERPPGQPGGRPAALTWLANQGARSLGGLRAGQWVTTGSCTCTVLVAPGARVMAKLGSIGCAELQCV